ncbi:MAG: hypothetical protein MASP_01780 [Candidatus Methanolliviera sp. GoM_asphalt]|nr:MAG: hypothetical protein MASP_01780 [Candidatus Methanolliviera sp. GoM_asphalt]
MQNDMGWMECVEFWLIPSVMILIFGIIVILSLR